MAVRLYADVMEMTMSGVVNDGMKSTPCCSFYGKNQHDVRKLVAGPMPLMPGSIRTIARLSSAISRTPVS